ncbi:MAG: TrgA family protein [Pseudomonadota bacterium]
MPTAAKLFGAILFAALAFFVTEEVKQVMPGEGRGNDLLSPVNALFGGAIGWRIVGTRAGTGYMSTFGFGLTTFFVTTVLALVWWSAYTMIERAVSGRYNDPGDALAGMGGLILDYWVFVATPNAMAMALLGSLVFGLIVEFISHRWS